MHQCCKGLLGTRGYQFLLGYWQVQRKIRRLGTHGGDLEASLALEGCLGVRTGYVAGYYRNKELRLKREKSLLLF